MRDRFAASLEIGGTITVDQLRKIKDLADQAHVQDFQIRDRHIWVYDQEAIDGWFEDLQDYLELEKIPYDHWCTHYGEIDAGYRYVRPGEDDVFVDSNDTGDRYVSRSDLLSAIEATETRDELIKALESVIDGTSHPLPPLKIVDPDGHPVDPAILEQLDTAVAGQAS